MTGPAKVYFAPLGTLIDDPSAWREVGTINAGALDALGSRAIHELEHGSPRIGYPEPAIVHTDTLSFSLKIVRVIVREPASSFCQNPVQHDGHFLGNDGSGATISCSGNR